jgi:hypothetical protein
MERPFWVWGQGGEAAATAQKKSLLIELRRLNGAVWRRFGAYILPDQDYIFLSHLRRERKAFPAKIYTG